MIKIESDTFNVDAVMSFFHGVDTNIPLSGNWNGIPWRIWLHEPTDSPAPAHWMLEMGDHQYPLRQSARWEQNDETKSWKQVRSSWRLRAADGRWIPALKDLGADLAID
jgi:hypothetical protein